MTNAEIAAALEELGTLYELDGADQYRVLAYGTAAQAIRDSPVSVAELAAAGRTTEIPGVGKTLAEKIDALLADGEIPAAAKLRQGLPTPLEELAAFRGERTDDDLVDMTDIRGDLHAHTTLSDGRNTLEEMAEAAKARGYAYLAMTDHSASHGFGDNVTADRLWKRIEEIRKWNAGKRGLSPPRGIGGQHRPRRLARLPRGPARGAGLGDRQRPHLVRDLRGANDRARIVAAIENPNVDCIGHLTGRLIGKRDPYAVDVEAVIEAAARTGTMLEINGNPNRRDLTEEHARLAADAGVPIVLNTDAHGIDTLDNMAYAVIVARGAGLTRRTSPTRATGGTSPGSSSGRPVPVFLCGLYEHKEHRN